MRFVQSEKPVTTKHDKLGDLSVHVSVPQVESVEETITWFGGADKLIAFLNGAIDTNAKNGSRAYLRGFDAKALDGENPPSVSELIAKAYEKAKEIAKEYTPQASTREPSALKKQASAALNIKAALASGKELSREELLAMVEGL